ncbi:MAG: alcohol dehydrogenase catalytic domain-containing protein [Candidatus Rokubacteria bacterium]|nr:alcohol dehydrogenase catalytic domain-containing protein [Candidatus Rokubacteria bacterium]
MPTIKASILPDRNAPLVVEEVTLDAPKTGEVLVRIAACGLCHSDLSVIDGTLPLPTPIVLGHEGAGVVEAVGPGVTLGEVNQAFDNLRNGVNLRGVLVFS